MTLVFCRERSSKNRCWITNQLQVKAGRDRSVFYRYMCRLLLILFLRLKFSCCFCCTCASGHRVAQLAALSTFGVCVSVLLAPWGIGFQWNVSLFSRLVAGGDAERSFWWKSVMFCVLLGFARPQSNTATQREVTQPLLLRSPLVSITVLCRKSSSTDPC